MRNGRRAATISIISITSHLRYWSCFWRNHLVWHISGRYHPAPNGPLYHCSTCDRDW